MCRNKLLSRKYLTFFVHFLMNHWIFLLWKCPQLEDICNKLMMKQPCTGQVHYFLVGLLLYYVLKREQSILNEVHMFSIKMLFFWRRFLRDDAATYKSPFGWGSRITSLLLFVNSWEGVSIWKKQKSADGVSPLKAEYTPFKVSLSCLAHRTRREAKR